MPFPVMAAAQLGAGILSGVLGSSAQAKMQKADMRERRRQFDAQHALSTRRQAMDEEGVARRGRGLSRTGGLRDMILQRVLGGMKPGMGVPAGGDPPPRPMGGY